jgi:hypothetical protein
MSQARFDTGQQYVWQPLVTNVAQQNASAAAFPVFNTGPDGLYRVDYASVVLEYAGGDGRAFAELCIYFGTGINYPFLACACQHALADLTGTWNNRAMEQISLPFMLPSGFAIMLRGGTSDGSGSTITGTVAISHAYGF